MSYAYLDDNVARMNDTVEAACREAGRTADSVLTVAAIKSTTVEEIAYLCEHHGLRAVGENRVQQLLERYEALRDMGVEIHFIGTLQTNKVKYIVDKVSMIQSLDSEKLAAEIQKQATKQNRTVRVLIEINSGNEESKSGVLPEEAEALALALAKYDRLQLCGFMTMAPKGDEASYRRCFGQTRELCRRVWRDTLGRDDHMELSMGMSESYGWAVSEGATIIRPGRVLFARPDGSPQHQNQ